MICATCKEPARTHEVTCSVCGEKRWPYTATLPFPYTCRRCLATPAEVRAQRLDQARRATETKRLRSPGGRGDAI